MSDSFSNIIDHVIYRVIEGGAISNTLRHLSCMASLGSCFSSKKYQLSCMEVQEAVVSSNWYHLYRNLFFLRLFFSIHSYPKQWLIVTEVFFLNRYLIFLFQRLTCMKIYNPRSDSELILLIQSSSRYFQFQFCLWYEN